MFGVPPTVPKEAPPGDEEVKVNPNIRDDEEEEEEEEDATNVETGAIEEEKTW